MLSWIKNLFIPSDKDIKKLWSHSYSLYCAMTILIIASLMLTGLHTYFSLTHPPTAEKSEIDTKTIDEKKTSTNPIETSETDTKAVQNSETIRKFIDAMGTLISILLALVAALFAFSSIGVARLGMKVSIAPTLRVIAKKKGNDMVMYAENIGKGPLFLTDMSIESDPTHSNGLVILKEQCLLSNVEILTKSISECEQASLAEKEKMTLLRFTNKEDSHEEILQALRCIHIQAKFTDVLGNKYEEKIKPETYTNHEEIFQTEDTKPSNTAA